MALVIPHKSLSETHLLQLIAGALIDVNGNLIPFAGDSTWGNITGDINDQLDLLALIESEISGAALVTSIIEGDGINIDASGPGGTGNVTINLEPESLRPFGDNTPLMKSAGDDTKLLRYDLSAISTGTTRTVYLQDGDGHMALLEIENVFTRPQTIDLGAVGETEAEGFHLRNETASTSHGNEHAPAIAFEAHGWHPLESVDYELEMTELFRVAAAEFTSNPVAGRLSWNFSVNGGPYNEKSYIDSDGNVAGLGYFGAGAGYAVISGPLDGPTIDCLFNRQSLYSIVPGFFIKLTDTSGPLLFDSDNTVNPAYRFASAPAMTTSVIEITSGLGFSGNYIDMGDGGPGVVTSKFRVQSDGSVQAAGAITGSNLSGTNTGNQTITLTGDVTGSGTASFAATIANDAVTYAKIQNVAGLSVMGRSANSSGDAADITGTNGQVLRVSGTTLGFGTIVAAGIASDAVTTIKILDANVTYAKMQSIAGLSIPGRASNTTGVMADITGTDGQVLRVAGTTLGFGSIATAGITDAAVTLAKMANLAANTIIGRVTASTGVPEALTSANVRTVAQLSTTDSPTFKSLTLSKSDGEVVATIKLTGSGGNAIGQILSLFSDNLSFGNSNRVFFALGKSWAADQAGYCAFILGTNAAGSGADTTNNRMMLGFHSGDDKFQVFNNGGATLGSGLAQTSPGNGNFIIAGNFAVGGSLTSGVHNSAFGGGTKCISLPNNGTSPSSSPADTCILYAVDASAGNATLGIRTETAVVTESVTSDRTLQVVINGTVYKICLKA